MTLTSTHNTQSHLPYYDVSVRNIVVFSWRSPWPQSVSRDGAYSDLITSFPSDEATVRFYIFAIDPPVVSLLELFTVDPNSYDSASINDIDVVLVNYGRLSCGSNQWGQRFSFDEDKFGRSWQSDSEFWIEKSDMVVAVLTQNEISGVNQKLNYFSMKLYQMAAMTMMMTTAEEGGGVLEYELSVDAKLDYLLWLHFAEIEGRVRRVGERVFDVFVNGGNSTRVDLYKHVGCYAAYTWHHTVKNVNFGG